MNLIFGIYELIYILQGAFIVLIAFIIANLIILKRNERRLIKNGIQSI